MNKICRESGRRTCKRKVRGNYHLLSINYFQDGLWTSSRLTAMQRSRDQEERVHFMEPETDSENDDFSQDHTVGG